LGVYEGIVDLLMPPTAASKSAQSFLHRRLDRFEKRVVAERLGEESRRALSESPRAHLIIRFGGNEDYRNPTIHFAQLGLKFETAQPRHLDIQQQTVSLREPRIEEFLGGREGRTFIASRTKQTGQRIAHELVVIDDPNQRNERLTVRCVP
jgi:hypothetical protein